MKWGKRKAKREAERGGLPNARKIKKQMKKANKTPEKNKNTIHINKKVNKEYVKSKEYKNYYNFAKALSDSIPKEAKYVQLSPDLAKAFKKVESDASNKYSDIRKKHIDSYASAMLKDLGYKDTQKGRDYLKKKKLVA